MDRHASVACYLAAVSLTLFFASQAYAIGPEVTKDKFPDYDPAHTVIKCPYLPAGMVDIPLCGGQRATPDAAGIQGNHVFVIGLAFQRSPVPENDGGVPGAPVLVFEPGLVGSFCRPGWSAGAAKDFSVLVAESKARKDVADQASAPPAPHVVIPAPYPVFVHAAIEFSCLVRAQTIFDFRGVVQGVL